MKTKSSVLPSSFIRRDPKNISGYIYIFSIGHDSLYKVGKSVNWRRRLKALRAANPNLKAVLDILVRDRHAAELAVHEAIKYSRVEREIFRLSESDIDKIRDILVRFVE